MTTERAIEVLKSLSKHFESKENVEAFNKAIEVMTKVHTYDKEMKELEEYLKETRS